MRKFSMLESRDILLIATVLIFVVFLFTTGIGGEQKTLLVFAFYFAISLIYNIDSRFAIGAAILLLITTAIYLPQSERTANQLAIYAYYFLVVGVVLQIIEYIRESKEEGEPASLKEKPVGKYIAIVSGKGGVGKTTIATNLAATLSKNIKCLLIDFDVTMPAIDIAMGIESERSLNDALSTSKIKQSIHRVRGCDVIPASPDPTFFQNRENIKKLKELIESVRNEYNIIVMDFPPGSNLELLNEFEDLNLILVANPDKPSLVNLYNVKDLVSKTKSRIAGLIINKANDIDIDNIEETLKLPVISVLPEEKRVRDSFDEGVPVVLSDENIEFSTEIRDLAEFLVKYLITC